MAQSGAALCPQRPALPRFEKEVCHTERCQGQGFSLNERLCQGISHQGIVQGDGSLLKLGKTMRKGRGEAKQIRARSSWMHSSLTET